jgi:hypothetical protein
VIPGGAPTVGTDRAAAAPALTSFDAIFVSSHRLGGGPQLWNAQCLASVPGLKEIASASAAEGTAHAFAMIRWAGTG